jgi:hypothetical protein
MVGELAAALETDGKLEIDVFREVTLVETDRYPSPDILKIDVEGAELRAFRGFEGDLPRYSRCVCGTPPRVERPLSTSMEVIEAYLRDHGFDIGRLRERSDE